MKPKDPERPLDGLDEDIRKAAEGMADLLRFEPPEALRSLHQRLMELPQGPELESLRRLGELQNRGPWYRKAAEHGDAEAQFDLGGLYEYGEGVRQDYTQAAAWYRKSAEQGDALAQYNLGGLYHNGQGVPQDNAQATARYRKAAEQGVALAQWNLGTAYLIGRGVPQDYAEAYFWMNLAAAGVGKSAGVKQEDIDRFREEAASHLAPADLSRVQERARKWYEDHPAKADAR